MKKRTWLDRFWSRLTGRVARPSATAKQPVRLKLEELEDRIVPAATLYFDDSVSSMAVDTAGNEYVHYEKLHGPVDLDPDPSRNHYVTGYDYSDFGNTGQRYLVKYSPTHEVLWVQSGADTFPVAHVQIAADSQGIEHLYKIGRTITKSDLNGNTVWSTQLDNTTYVSQNAIAADGSFFGTGMFNTAADLDVGTTWADGRDLVTGNGQSVFVAKWAADGTLQWSRTITSSAANGKAPNVWSGAIAEADGVVYAGGMYRGTLSLGGLTNDTINAATSVADGYLAAYGTDGAFQSVAHFIDANPRFMVAAGSDVYVSAQFRYTADMDPGAGQTLLTPGNVNGENLAVARLTYDNSGATPNWTLNWAEKFVSTRNNVGGGLAVSGNDLYVSGAFGTTTDFDPSSGTYNLTAGGQQDIFAMKLNAATGGLGWVTQMGSTQPLAVTPSQENAGLVLTSTGIYLGGYVQNGPVNFVGTDRSTFQILDANLGVDAFVAKLGLDGSYQSSFGVGAVSRTIDNGDAGYSEGGSDWKNSTSGYESDSRTHNKGNGSNTATWTFTGLPNGTYEVGTTYPAAGKNASSAPYRVNGTLVPVNQKASPNDYTFAYTTGGGTWKSLGTYTVTNGTITVVLSDAANGTVVADAVRVWMVASPAPLLAADGEVTDNPGAEILTGDQLQPIIAEAISRWQARGISAAQLEQLLTMQVYIGSLGGATLGQANEGDNTIWLDGNAAGHGWFIDSTPGDDSEFSAEGDQGEQGRIDLLSVLMHEMGHLIGEEHEAGGVMAETLATGTRSSPASAGVPADALLSLYSIDVSSTDAWRGRHAKHIR